MNFNRRQILKQAGIGLGAAAVSPYASIFANNSGAAAASGPKRIIFFLQNHGFNPITIVPKGGAGSLEGRTLPLPTKTLEPYLDRMHIINGLHGIHTNPGHGAYFGALGGYRGGYTAPPSAPTLDYILSKTLPQTILPLLCIGMDSLPSMREKPTVATTSARGVNQPIFMYSDPNLLYQILYGNIAKGDILKRNIARNNIVKHVHEDASQLSAELPKKENERYSQFVDGFADMSLLQKKLNGMSGHLKKFAPEIDERFTKPKFETDWHDILLDLGISALKSGITNTLTIASGRGMVDTASWFGIEVEMFGHGLGHINQPGNEIWDKIRKYNCQMLIKIIKELESVPEGNGSMMDNTLIVYTSNNADTQHTRGQNWPIVLLGNWGGRIKTGQFTQMAKEQRPINALYASLLQAASGKSVDSFNMSATLANKYDKGSGPLLEVLA